MKMGPSAFPTAKWDDPKLCEALRDLPTRQQLAAHLLPALCLALLDPSPEVRILAAFRLMQLGPDAQTVLGALREAQADPDERVRKAAAIALQFIESGEAMPWLM
jgi:HEAT repeat protein